MKIGIRREGKNEWERRVPLTPGHVRAVRAQGLEVVVQPSAIRVFSDREYAAAGATVSEDLSACKVVFGIKEFPVGSFTEGQVYVFFPHVIKGQPHNMPMLADVLRKGATLIDYERVTDESRRRLIFFGNYAGVAGMIETLFTLGQRLRSEGIDSPFALLRRPLDYASLDDARVAVAEVGKRIESDGLPESIAPLVIGFVGYGNVSLGAQGILDLLPHEEVLPRDLPRLSGAARNRVYKVVFREEHISAPDDPATPFNLQEYFAKPERHHGIFEQHLPYLSVLVNGIYWESRFPRLVTKAWLREAWSGKTPPKLRVIGDISCDIDGSIECTVRSTDPGNPVFTYLPAEDRTVDGWVGAGPAIMAVDTLPAELPRESSESFGGMLLPFVAPIAKADYSGSFVDLALPPELKRAVIVHRGSLTPAYQYLEKFLA